MLEPDQVLADTENERPGLTDVWSLWCVRGPLLKTRGEQLPFDYAHLERLLPELKRLAWLDSAWHTMVSVSLSKEAL